LRRSFVVLASAAIIGGVPPSSLAGDPAATVAADAYVDQVQVIETADLGLGRPAGLAWSRAGGALVVVDETSTTGRLVTPLSDDRGSITFGTAIVPASLTFDPARRHLLAIDDRTGDLLSLGAARPGSARLADRRPVELAREPDGAVVDDQGNVWLLDAERHRIARADGAEGLAFDGTVDQARGLAIHPDTGHFFVVARTARSLVEIDRSGRTISKRSLASFGLADARGLVLAPSADPTDDPATLDAYVADGGRVEDGVVREAGIREFALEPIAQVSLAADDGDLVNTINTFQWDPASPDPSGLAFHSGDDRLVLVDGEVDETTGAGFNGANGWLYSRTGTVSATFDTTGFNVEAVGIAYDSAGDRYFISNDSARRIFVIDPGPDGIPATGDDGTRTSFVTNGFGSQDPEGLAFGGGDLFIADGVGREVYRIDPGPNGTFQGGGDDVISHFDVATHGQSDPEGIDYDPSTGRLWVVSNASNTDLLEITPSGVPVRSVDLTFSVSHPGGLAIAPATSGGGNHVYVADRGVDNNTDPTENDGRIYEIAVTVGAPPSGTLDVLASPERILDTRSDIGLANAFQSKTWRTFSLPSSIPNDAFAITGNLTVVNPGSNGYLSVLPEALLPGQVPAVSSLNFKAHETAANNLVAPVEGGSLAIVYWGSGSAHVVLDVTGYFVPGAGNGGYVELTPARIMDSRSGNGVSAGRFRHGQPKTFQVRGVGGVPSSSNVIAVAGNLTVTGQQGAGTAALTTTATGTPATSTLNFVKADNRANGIVIALSGSGGLSAVVRGTNAHLLFDVTGYFTTGPGGAAYHQLDPIRMMDTRSNVGLNGPFRSHDALTLQVGSASGSVPSGAVGITGNLTVTGQDAKGYVSMTAQPADDPTTSTINFPVGVNRANGVVAPLSSGAASFTYVATAGGGNPSTELLLDVTGYFQ
jgi:hypothetical protein